MQVELNLTERFFAAKLGIKPLLFRPPYSIDQEPDTADQVRPLEIAQAMGYISIGDKITPRLARQSAADRRADHPGGAETAVTALRPRRSEMRQHHLLHDGGGDRRETVRAVPMIIDGCAPMATRSCPYPAGRQDARRLMPAIRSKRALGGAAGTGWASGCTG